MSCDCSDRIADLQARLLVLELQYKDLSEAHAAVAGDVDGLEEDMQCKASQHDLQSYVDDLPDAGALGDLYVELVDTLKKHGIELDVRSLRRYRMVHA